MAAYISMSVMNNSVSSIVLIGFSKSNKSYQKWLDLPYLLCVCCTVRKYTESGNA